jgi:hypothetical protein
MDSLLVESASTPGSNEPAVVVSYEDHQIMLTLSEAQTRGIGLVNAAAYAESEGALFKALCPNLKKGFGKPNKDAQLALSAIALVRENRQPLPLGINPIFGFNTQMPLVEVDYNQFKVILHLDEVRHHAMLLLEAAEAARFDAFWYKFGNEKTGLSREEMAAIVEEYRLYKERYSVEKLFSL